MVVLADRTNAAPRDFTVVMTPDALEYEEVSSQEDARAEKARAPPRSRSPTRTLTCSPNPNP